MILYPGLNDILIRMPGGSADWAAVFDHLVAYWLDDYARTTGKMDAVETRQKGFSYLFDIAAGRLIAAWGISGGRSDEARDKSRMAGHPLGGSALYHRGHAIPHTLGGGTDINLVTQLGRINVGAFRPLERQAVATPGALYFTYWHYPARGGQVPRSVDQGLLIAGRHADIMHHAN